ncbi:C4-dicarboxylate transport sensor protein DctB [Aliiroseovarius sp. xm-m-379]|uniref:sensor histidine kinase n=2 Tax=unclassified Aliiroseovarius TaxID=2623558 RepID=UPI0019E7C2C0|nr:C4-dicarboxylate transport sensor protein DctB [Aliiroseovarius sp. xm-d-517]NRP26108.1 C4-dicarboxylate transport sensor protein DctB [Aliiroseovarius sp. xm-m-379]NRP31591.1 C4-dicarboxylate transport sensor protein DctB [Aliiroseovarius sp. xm-m-314]NRP34907.1 C4-dicarboxylate transport sensor protein DctB [Aliiroseovarius sp. xm-a-104]NRP42134.1 C4-dicarboxylate transport sensor protein DctB [Aliiroseovarius sp. xm-m-339-2]NRP45565.1 C4-dicarboxylate transport sensor protein DctB [Aliir
MADNTQKRTQKLMTDAPAPRPGVSLRGRLALLVLVSLAAAVIFFSNRWLTERYTETTRNRAELRVALYSGNLISELQRNSVVPLLLSRDPALINALNSGDFAHSSARLISYLDEIEAKSLVLLDGDGRIVAATNRETLGESHRSEPHFVDALRSSETVFSAVPTEAGAYEFTYSRKIEAGNKVIGVIVVEVDLRKFEKSWAGISDAVLVTNSEGNVILATEARWRGKPENEALEAVPAMAAIRRNFRNSAEWTALPSEMLFLGEAVMRQEARVPFQGWRIASFTSYASVREKVNAVLSLEIMAFAMLLSLTFYLISRRAQFRSVRFAQESADLRLLNNQLQREIAERQRAEKNLQVAEQTLAQSSKLAALGEMSAAVSHELNQPLAAMKTYLAGAKLLLQRKRPDEALSSFQRIDDLIERMGAITKQLKSYARKGGDAFEPMDVRECVSSALSMMEPQLKSREVRITRNIPRDPVMVMGDRLRLEQVLINLMRNAIDATKTVEAPQVDIIVSRGDYALISVRDNGDGVTDLDNLFEPFYTTKAPGDGVGLGLAISSGIVNDFGGRLTARNGQDGGAVFEVELPLLKEDDSDIEAAE